MGLLKWQHDLNDKTEQVYTLISSSLLNECGEVNR